MTVLELIGSSVRRMVRTLALIALILALLYGYIVLNIASLTEERLSEELNAPVRIGQMALGWNSLRARDVEIGNVAESKLQPALFCGLVEVEGTIVHPLIPGRHAAHVHLHKPELVIEFYDRRGDDNNWSRMLQPLSENDEQGDTKPRVLVDHLLITELHVTLVGGRIGREPVKVIIEKIEEFDLGDGASFPIEAVAEAIYNVVVNRVVKNIFVPRFLRGPNKVVRISFDELEALKKP